MANREVTVAYLHSPVSMPGVFGTLTRLDVQTVPNLRMRMIAQGLVLEQDGIHALVPLANVKIFLFKHAQETT